VTIGAVVSAWIKKIGAEKMTQLIDRVWCRIFHKAYHTVLEKGSTVPGWRFVYCNNCKRAWPERCASSEGIASS